MEAAEVPEELVQVVPVPSPVAKLEATIDKVRAATLAPGSVSISVDRNNDSYPGGAKPAVPAVPEVEPKRFPFKLVVIGGAVVALLAAGALAAFLPHQASSSKSASAVTPVTRQVPLAAPVPTPPPPDQVAATGMSAATTGPKLNPAAQSTTPPQALPTPATQLPKQFARPEPTTPSRPQPSGRAEPAKAALKPPPHPPGQDANSTADRAKLDQLNKMLDDKLKQ